MWVSLEAAIDGHRTDEKQEKLDAIAKAEAAKTKKEKAELRKKAKAKKPVINRMETAKPLKPVKPAVQEPGQQQSIEAPAQPIVEKPKLETSTPQYRPLQLSDTRIALFFFFFIQVAFFGTGNIASISSFSLDSVYRLIPIFNPFTMGALLIYKILIPFTLISAFLGILNKAIGVAPSAVFMVVMAISDVLTLNFFYMVKDEGSWLDIGTTISHFCIASLLFVFVSALELLSGLFVKGIKYDRDEEMKALVEFSQELEQEKREKEAKKLEAQVEKEGQNKEVSEQGTAEEKEELLQEKQESEKYQVPGESASSAKPGTFEHEVEQAMRKVQRVKGVIDSEVSEGSSLGDSYAKISSDVEEESDAETVIDLEESDAETVVAP